MKRLAPLLLALVWLTVAARTDAAARPEPSEHRAANLEPCVLNSSLSALVGEAEAASESSIDFSTQIMPLLTKAGCNMGACHGSFQGRGNLRFSLLGYDSAADYAALFRDGFGRRVSAVAPEQSLVLLKATGAVAHGGGQRMTRDSQAFRLLRAFIEQGMPPPADDDPQVTSLQVSTSEAILQAGQHVQLRVTAHWSNGSKSDVTPWALFDAQDKQIADVSVGGRITGIGKGRTPVMVRYLGQAAVVAVTIPYEQPQPDFDFPAANYIDELTAAEWRKVGLRPAALSSDTEFVRRVHVDLIGTLPTPDEVRAFVDSDAADKRARLIDALLERPEYVSYWSLKWGDLLRMHRRYVGDKGLASFSGWVRQMVRENRPIDQVTRELLTAQGNLFTSGPVAYYFVDPGPTELAETTSQVFMGVRLTCARCHHHPLEVWSQQDYFGLAACFTRLETKDNADNGKYGGAKLLRVVANPSRNRRLAMEAEPAVLGSPVTVAPGTDLRIALAERITSPDNPYFARNFANRYWGYLMGRGLVEQIDDLRITNPPSMPAVLDALADDFIRSGYDMKHMLRTICNSRTYQLASNLAPEHDHQNMFFSYRAVRRLPAEVLLDAVNQAAGTSESFEGLPSGTRAIALADPNAESYFLDTFGRSARTSPCECSSTTVPDLTQALHMINGAGLHEKCSSDGGRVATLIEAQASDEAIVKELYLATLGRWPSGEERSTIAKLVGDADDRRECYEDLLWTLLNSAEFTFNH